MPIYNQKPVSILRIVIISLLLVISFYIDIGSRNTFLGVPYVFYIFIAGYTANIFYLVFLKSVTSNWVAYLQFALDLLLESLLIYVSDGVFSPFINLYMVIIIGSGMSLYRKGVLFTASGASILLGVIGNLQYHAITPFVQMNYSGSNEILPMLVMNFIAFFVIGELSANLSLNLKNTGERLEEKSTGFAELQSFHENIVQSMSGGLLAVDLTGRITSFNRSAEKITGYTNIEVVNHHYSEFFAWEELVNVFDSPEKFDGSLRIDKEFITAENDKRLLGITFSSLRSKNGNPMGILGIFQDLTIIKKMEEDMKRKERLALIGELAAKVAHEIRNPLASLSGAMQILKEELKLEGNEEILINIALKETERLDNIINEFMSYAGGYRVNIEKTDILDLLHETVAMLKHHPEAKEIEFSISESINIDDNIVSADVNRLKQVFWNLILNAIQAMPGGGKLKIKLLTRTSENGSKFLEICFKDTGVGIPVDKLESIFIPFFTTKENGSGLGLAIASRIVEDHNGMISVAVNEGGGTEFTVSLPF